MYILVFLNTVYFFQENSPLKGGRGHASLVIKCKLCSRENSIGNIVTLYFMLIIINQRWPVQPDKILTLEPMAEVFF